LSWASCNEPVEGGDWAGCAKVLLEHGMPGAEPDREDPEWVLIGGSRKHFSDEVSEVLLAARHSLPDRVCGRPLARKNFFR
jgi:hypothetical protein